MARWLKRARLRDLLPMPRGRAHLVRAAGVELARHLEARAAVVNERFDRGDLTAEISEPKPTPRHERPGRRVARANTVVASQHPARGRLRCSSKNARRAPRGEGEDGNASA